jgi:hypothetical protein
MKVDESYSSPLRENVKVLKGHKIIIFG